MMIRKYLELKKANTKDLKQNKKYIYALNNKASSVEFINLKTLFLDTTKDTTKEKEFKEQMCIILKRK